MGLSVQIHPDKYEVTLYAEAPPSSFAVVKAIEGGASVSLFLQSTAKCDELIAAACEAKRMLEGAQPAAPCPAISDAGTTCIAGEGYPHRDANGYEWGAPDTDDSHPSRWISGMQQPRPAADSLDSPDGRTYSDPDAAQVIEDDEDIQPPAHLGDPGSCPSCGSEVRAERCYVPGGTGMPVDCGDEWHEDDDAESSRP